MTLGSPVAPPGGGGPTTNPHAGGRPQESGQTGKLTWEQVKVVTLEIKNHNARQTRGGRVGGSCRWEQCERRATPEGIVWYYVMVWLYGRVWRLTQCDG